MNDIKIKLIQKICESDNYYLLSAFLKNFESKSPDIISESPSIYESEKPMTEEEVENYFKEEEVKLPAEILDILKISEEQIKNGQTFTNEEVNSYFEEWLKD
ncbi:hypothetical protein [Epilithonimonas zeae]|uniref:hypothetical protein n=1 Tax=Epilithonimonas zeae TaxID=1416779 RepID=UPI00200C5A21|nr:hypothetical protein [Epilithonimonas zeae]UQB70323.1 hypothetical protein KI430_07835 [Epilithonimonas zeae]